MKPVAWVCVWGGGVDRLDYKSSSSAVRVHGHLHGLQWWHSAFSVLYIEHTLCVPKSASDGAGLVAVTLN